MEGRICYSKSIFNRNLSFLIDFLFLKFWYQTQTDWDENLSGNIPVFDFWVNLYSITITLAWKFVGNFILVTLKIKFHTFWWTEGSRTDKVGKPSLFSILLLGNFPGRTFFKPSRKLYFETRLNLRLMPGSPSWYLVFFSFVDFFVHQAK